jgi:fermentation-respiration switch protein FrsA (DUF1100 family)
MRYTARQARKSTKGDIAYSYRNRRCPLSFLSVPSPFSPFYLGYDPQTALRKVPCPVLALLGTQDRQVPPKQNVPKIAQALLEGGNPDFTVKELPGLNHLLQTSPTGNPSEYREIEETFAPAALERISGWIRKRFVGGEKAARVGGDKGS